MITRRMLLLMTLLLLAAARTIAQDLSVDDIVRKYAQALGGYEKWQEVQSMKLIGTHTYRGLEYPLTIITSRSNQCRLEIAAGENKEFLAFDGKAAWENDAAQPDHRKEIRDTRKKNFIEMLAVFPDALIDYQAKGHQVKWLGQEKVDNDKAHKLAVTLGNGRTEHWFIDAASFLLVKRSSTFIYNKAEASQSIYYMDYKSVDGLMIPLYLERAEFHYVRGYEIKQVEINPDLDQAALELLH